MDWGVVLEEGWLVWRWGDERRGKRQGRRQGREKGMKARTVYMLRRGGRKGGTEKLEGRAGK